MVIASNLPARHRPFGLPRKANSGWSVVAVGDFDVHNHACYCLNLYRQSRLQPAPDKPFVLIDLTINATV